MNNIAANKKEIRQHIKILKANLDSQTKSIYSLSVLNKIEKDISFINSQKILIFWSMDDEIYTHDFILKWSLYKEIYLPVINGDTLILRRFTSLGNMIPEPRFGILEPKGEDFHDWNDIDYAIIPGVAFDKNNNRLGRGKGFYDRILNSINSIRVGICFNFQLIDSVPVELNDVKMDIVFSNDSLVIS